jgi:hypothetical protein
MNLVALPLTVIVLAGGALSSQPAQAPAHPPGYLDIDAEMLIKQCIAHYDAAHTYQADVLRQMKFGDQYDKTILHIASVSDGHSYVKRGVIEQTVDVATRRTTAKDGQRVVDDGSTVHYLYSNRKEYAEAPHTPSQVAALYTDIIADLLKSAGKLMVTESTTNGHRQYMLTNSNASSLIVIDQETNSFALIHMAMKLGSQTGALDMMPTNQVFDMPVPDSDLAWKLPAGYSRVSVREMPSGW